VAVLFDDASSEYLEYAAALVSEPPLTMASWFRAQSDSVGSVLVCISKPESFNTYYALHFAGELTGDPVIAVTRCEGSPKYATTTTGYTVDTWHHACGVWAATDDRRAYIDGGSRGVEHTPASPTGLSATAIGRLTRSTPSNYMNGDIACPAVWDAALTDDEVAALATGIWPPLIRPESLVAFWPLYNVNDMRDIKGGYNLTAYNTPTTAENPRILMPHRRVFYSVPATLGGVGSIFDSGIFRPVLVR